VLYLAHSRFLHDYGQPLVAERVQAWDHGSVVKVVYRECSVFGDAPIQMRLASKGPWTKLPAVVVDVMERTWNEFGGYSALKLRNMTHEIGPWKQVHQPGIKNVTISNEAIGQAWPEFSRLIEKPVRQEDSTLAQAVERYRSILGGMAVQEPKGDLAFLIDELDATEDLRKHAASQLS